MVEAAAEAAAEEVVDLVVEEVVEDGKYYSVYTVNDMRRNEINAFIHLMIMDCLLYYYCLTSFLFDLLFLYLVFLNGTDSVGMKDHQLKLLVRL